MFFMYRSKEEKTVPARAVWTRPPMWSSAPLAPSAVRLRRLSKTVSMSPVAPGGTRSRADATARWFRVRATSVKLVELRVSRR
jgi:hypothetical protein